MVSNLRARELALHGATIVFFLVALAGIASGAESHVAVLRALAAGVGVAYVGRWPLGVLAAALDPPAQTEDEQAEDQAPADDQAPAANRRAA